VEKANKTTKEPKVGRKLKYDPNRILKLWTDGKSISEISAAMKPISKVFVHRVLTVKFPKQYADGQKARQAAREAAKKEAAK
jgi:hypothetical protein